MTGLVVDIRVASEAVRQVRLMGRPELRQQAIDLVIAEVRAGRDGSAVARRLQAARFALQRGAR